MFADLDATLRAVFDTSAAPAALRAAEVAFETPDKDYKPSQATLDAFLYDIGENRELRDPARHLSWTGNGYSSTGSPLRVDCTYLVTAWSAKTGAVKTAEEHQLLSLALGWLARFAVIDDTLLVGALKNPPQPYPVTTRVAQSREADNRGHFWSALGIAPRACFSLTATVALQSSDPIGPFPEVEQRGPDDPRPKVRMAYTSVTDAVLAGRVLDATLAAVSGATVRDVAGGATATTADDGRFAFPGLDFGDHLLRVSVTGHADVERSVHYAPDSQLHDFVLPRP